MMTTGTAKFDLILPVLREPSGPEPIALAARFEEMATRHADRVAVVAPGDNDHHSDNRHGEERLTYAALHERARSLAARLAWRGIGLGDTVALAVPRSIDLVVAVVAPALSGAAYVPLDPTYPSERLAMTLAGCEPVLIRTTRDVAEILPQGKTLDMDLDDAYPQSASTSPPDLMYPGASALQAFSYIDGDALHRDPEAISAATSAVASDAASARVASNRRSLRTAHPSNPAYVIYTLGSTGRPKGFVVTNDNVTRLFSTTNAWFAFGENDTWSLFHSYVFDFSVWEMWGALLFGGRLIVVPLDVARDPHAFRALLARERVTVLNQPPSAFYQLASAETHALDAPRPGWRTGGCTQPTHRRLRR